MPFKSAAQMRFMFAKHKDIAKRWVKEGSPTKGLPEHVGDKAVHKKAVAKHKSKRKGR